MGLAHVLTTEGYVKTTTNAIAEDAGVSIGSLYQYFPNKDAIVVALAERHMASIADAFVAHLRRPEHDALDLPQLTDEVLRFAVALTGRDELHALLALEAARTPALDERAAAFEHAVAIELVRHLERLDQGGGDVLLRARLAFTFADAALHRVVLPGPVAERPERLAASSAMLAASLRAAPQTTP